jgi:hypothetical protein
MGEAQPWQLREGAVVEALAIRAAAGVGATAEEVEFEDGADLAVGGRRARLDALQAETAKIVPAGPFEVERQTSGLLEAET